MPSVLGKGKEQVVQQKKKQSRVEMAGEYTVQSRWFHLLVDPILRGDLAKLSGSEFKVLVTIKAHCNHATGLAWPSVNTVAALTGLSSATTKRAIKKLKLDSYLKVEKKQRKNTYKIIEALEVQKNGSDEKEQMYFDYAPSSIQKQLAAIKEFCTDGDTNITINLQINNTQNNFFGEKKLTKDEIDAIFKKAGAP